MSFVCGEAWLSPGAEMVQEPDQDSGAVRLGLVQRDTLGWPGFASRTSWKMLLGRQTSTILLSQFSLRNV